MRTLRRYEILLPLRFNNGQPVPESLIADTLIELEERFGAVSWEEQTIRGYWQHQGAVLRDNNTRLIVDVADTPESHAFFVSFKEKLKIRFQQIDIWLISHTIDVL